MMMTVVNKTTVVAGTRNTVATMANARKGAMAPAVPCAMKVRGIPAKTDGAANTVAAARSVVDFQAPVRNPMVVVKITVAAGQAQAANRRESLVAVAGQVQVADRRAAMAVVAVRIANLRAVMVAAKTVGANPMAAAAKITTAADGTEIEGTTKAAGMGAALRSA